MYRFIVLLIILSAFAPPGFAQGRFSGAGELSPSKTQTSANQRFVLDAAAFPPGADFSENKPEQPSHTPSTAPKALEQLGGRFGLTAQLANPAVPNEACTGGPIIDPIFRNGFE